MRLINAYSHPYSRYLGSRDMYTTHVVVADASRSPAFSRGGPNLTPKISTRSSLQGSKCTLAPPCQPHPIPRCSIAGGMSNERRTSPYPRISGTRGDEHRHPFRERRPARRWTMHRLVLFVANRSIKPEAPRIHPGPSYQGPIPHFFRVSTTGQARARSPRV